jgi:protein transport protein SEC61 subunit gamma-like protein
MDILERSWEVQDRMEKSVTERFRSNKYSRVLKMAVKPTPDEFIKTLQVTFIGMLLIGALGFAIYKIWTGLGEVIRTALDLSMFGL